MKTQNKNIKVLFLVCLLSQVMFAGNSPFDITNKKMPELSKEIKGANISEYNRHMKFSFIEKHFVQQANFAFSSSMNLTGTVKKQEQSNFEKLLHWDCRIKVKLNKNLNIIFSYN
ncbi:MAG: hypothetical protein JNL60_00285 [Bacteroidia bacterium]|nr:hypothetical protein [Bacteroidia bacterium]